MHTSNDRRKLIAEHLGWHTVQQNPLYPDDKSKMAWFFGKDMTALCGIPDYCNDLNAMHEAEKSLHDSHSCSWFWAYADILAEVTPGNLGKDSYIHATADHRSEAFAELLNRRK